MRTAHLLALPLALLLRPGAVAAAPPAAAPADPRYAADGRLLRPEGYREWIYLSSGAGMSYGPGAAAGGAHPPFDNVFVHPAAYRHFLATGTWPDRTIFVLEVRASITNGSINKGGHYQDELTGLEAAVKDEGRFAERWAYFGFDEGPGRLAASAAPRRREACWKCHSEHGAVDNTFVQFYPTLLPVAERKGTLAASFAPPLTPQRWLRLLADRGYAEAERVYRQERARDPGGQLFEERTLNGLGYQLLRGKRPADAVAVFKLAAEAYPASANVHDSLAEAAEAAGDRSLARSESERALAALSGDRSLDDEARQGLTRAARDRLGRLGAR